MQEFLLLFLQEFGAFGVHPEGRENNHSGSDENSTVASKLLAKTKESLGAGERKSCPQDGERGRHRLRRAKSKLYILVLS